MFWKPDFKDINFCQFAFVWFFSLSICTVLYIVQLSYPAPCRTFIIPYTVYTNHVKMFPACCAGCLVRHLLQALHQGGEGGGLARGNQQSSELMKLKVLRGCFEAYNRGNLQYDYAQDRTAMSTQWWSWCWWWSMSATLLTHRHTSYVVLVTTMRYAHRSSKAPRKH